ncbi:hypothetical protein ABLE91_01070 [Aquabacter sp. CN5-332]|uniref:hypothetical protein n=1 Tax=Aquabacter sp. CN5-332 TaxID=3156608 RepID=UPI0032B44081
MTFNAFGFLPFSIAFFVAMGAACLVYLAPAIGLLTLRGQAVSTALGTVSGLVSLSAVILWNNSLAGRSSGNVAEVVFRGVLMSGVAAFCGTAVVTFIAASRRSRH